MYPLKRYQELLTELEQFAIFLKSPKYAVLLKHVNIWIATMKDFVTDKNYAYEKIWLNRNTKKRTSGGKDEEIENTLQNGSFSEDGQIELSQTKKNPSKEKIEIQG